MPCGLMLLITVSKVRPERDLSGLSNFILHRKRLDHSLCVSILF